MAKKITEVDTYTFTDMYVELLDQQLTEMNEKFGVCCHTECVVLDQYLMTAEEENIFLQKMDKLPVSDKTFYPFRTCIFRVIPDFAKRKFVNLFLEYKNTFQASAPTTESLARAKETVGMLDDTSVKLTDLVLKTGTGENPLTNDISGYDLDMLFLDAKQEYQGTEFNEFCENATTLDMAVIITDFIYRHPELAHILEAVKALRQKIRNELKLGDNDFVGF